MQLKINFFLQSFVSGWIAKSSWYVVLWNRRSAVRIPGETGKTSLIRCLNRCRTGSFRDQDFGDLVHCFVIFF